MRDERWNPLLSDLPEDSAITAFNRLFKCRFFIGNGRETNFGKSQVSDPGYYRKIKYIIIKKTTNKSKGIHTFLSLICRLIGLPDAERLARPLSK